MTRKELSALKGRLREDFTIEAIGRDNDIITLCPMFRDDFEKLKRALDEFEGMLPDEFN